MKKFIAVVVFMLCAAVAFAGTQNVRVVENSKDWKTVIIDNTTGDYQSTFVAETTINPDSHVILGYSLFDIGGGSSESVIALHDAESTDIYVDESLITENEALDGASVNEWFATPKNLNVQLNVRQGARTRVAIYYANK